MARRHLSPDVIAKKWADKTAGATALMEAGVRGVTENPAEAAVRQAQLWIDNLNRAFRERIWQNALGSVTLADWQQAMISKGIPVIADRVRKAMPRYQAFITAYLAWYDATVAPQLASLPRGGIDRNIERAVLVIRASSDFKGQFKRRTLR